MALNLLATKDLAWQDRKAASFVSTPLHTGGNLVGYLDSRLLASDLGPVERWRLRSGTVTVPEKVALANAANGVRLGTAMAISGAAASPNWGYQDVYKRQGYAQSEAEPFHWLR